MTYPDLNELSPDARQAYKIGGKAEATARMREYTRLIEKMEENSLVAKQQREEIDFWLNRVNGILNEKKTELFRLLTDWHAARRAADPKEKTIELIHGDLTSRISNKGKLEVDEKIFIDFAKGKYPELLKTKYHPKLEEVKKHIEQTGEILPGVAIVGKGEVSFDIKPRRIGD